MGKLKDFFSLIKLSHTIFALPFALASMLIAAVGLPSSKILLLILACMVTGRTTGMAFNRYIDADIDAKNPRTAVREIPRGVIRKNSVLVLSIVSAALFALSTYKINPLCFYLSPIAIFFLFFYSFTKRFTSLAHLFVGFVLGMTPIGAWIAVTGTWAWEPVVLGVGVTFWVAGFDVIYATQDEKFDKEERLYSLVVRLGVRKALWAARIFHLLTLSSFLWFGSLVGATLPYYLAIGLCTALLFFEHRLVKPNDLSKVNAAFFNMNGTIAIIFLAGVVLSIL